MSAAVSLVQFSTLNLQRLLPLGRQALGRNLAEAADSAGFEPPLAHMLCIANLKDSTTRASAEAVIPYLTMFHAGFVIAADERDFAEILELMGMPAVMVESNVRGVNISFISGTLSQWKFATLRGCLPSVSREAREVFNKIFSEFKGLGLAAIFEAKQKPTQDGMFYLEYKK